MQRTRSRTANFSLTGKYIRTTTGQNVNFGANFAQSETITDTVTPGYFRLVREGAVLPMNGANAASMKLEAAEGSSWGYDQIYLGKYQGKVEFSGVSALGRLGRGGFSFLSSNFPSLSEHDVSAMYTDALAKAKTQGMDILTFYAEYAKTVSMVKGVAGRMLQRAHDVSRLTKKRLGASASDRKKFISAFSDTWLEYRYGWRILAYDIEDIMEVIRKIDEGLMIRLKAKGRSLKENTVRNQSGTSKSLSFPSGFAGNGDAFSHTYTDKEYHGTRAHAGVLIESYLRSVLTVDPLITGLEMVPYSFVLGWFFNIERWLAAVSPLLDERMLQAYLRVDYVKTREITVGPIASWNDRGIVQYNYSGSPSRLVFESVSWSRAPLGSGQQQLVLDYANNFDRSKFVDSLALIYGRLRHLRKFTSL